jgi:hypothetical protein
MSAPLNDQIVEWLPEAGVAGRIVGTSSADMSYLRMSQAALICIYEV